MRPYTRPMMGIGLEYRSWHEISNILHIIHVVLGWNVFVRNDANQWRALFSCRSIRLLGVYTRLQEALQIAQNSYAK